MKPYKIAVLSDIHIKANSRHSEYREYFDLLYNELRKLDLDCILICGDIFHSKTSQSPDSYLLCFEFFNKLKEIAELHILAGNHDLNEKNLEKLDAITPVTDNINENGNSVVYHKLSLDNYYFPLIKGRPEVVFRPFSLLDKEKWKYDRIGLRDDDILIGIFHGPLKGVKTDIGYVFSNAQDVKDFEEIDYMFCGDIHTKFNYYKNKKISVGNPIQQDFGEGLDKGFMYYEISSRDEFTWQYIQLPNIYPFITLQVGDPINDQLLKIARGARIRILSSESASATHDYASFVRHAFGKKLISLNILNKPKNNDIKNHASVIGFEEYIKNHPLKDDLLKKHEEYSKKINTKINPTNWNIKKIEWNNLFSYGPDNIIDFSKDKNMSIGVFGENYSGKTSLIDVICFSLFGGWTKPFVRNVYFINDKKQMADCYVEFEVNNKTYSIYRKLERKKGKKTDCDSTLDFKCLTDDKNLNQTKTTDTQNLINLLIGDMSDFLVTSLSTQFNNFSLIDEKNTKRKEYFSRFLGILQYEEIYELVKKDLKDLRKEIEVIYKYNNLDAKKKEIEDIILAKDILRDSVEQECLILRNQISQINDHIKQYDLIYENKVQLKTRIQIEKEQLNKARNQLIECFNKIKNYENNIDISYMENINIENIEKINLKLVDINKNIFFNEKEIERLEKDKSRIELLKTKKVPCEYVYASQCHLLKNDNLIISQESNIIEKLNENVIILNNLKKEKNNQEELLKTSKKTLLLLEEEKKRKNNFDQLNSLIESLTLKISLLEKSLSEKEFELLQYEFEENLYIEEKNKVKSLESKLGSLNNQSSSLFSENQIYKFQLNQIIDDISKFNELNSKCELLEIYSSLVGKNGIIVSILNGYIPAIETLMNQIISNIANFKVHLNIEDEKYIEIYIEDEISKRFIESASGSQKTIVAYALRLAILSYSQICSPDLFILDEPGTALDSNHLIQFTKLLDLIKANQKTIMLVTHISTLKDCVDIIYTVDKSSGYSKILT